MTNDEKVDLALNALQGAMGAAKVVSDLGVLPADVAPIVRTVAKLGGAAVREIETLRIDLEAARSKPGGVTAEDLVQLNDRVDEQERALMALLGV